MVSYMGWVNVLAFCPHDLLNVTATAMSSIMVNPSRTGKFYLASTVRT